MKVNFREIGRIALCGVGATGLMVIAILGLIKFGGFNRKVASELAVMIFDLIWLCAFIAAAISVYKNTKSA